MSTSLFIHGVFKCPWERPLSQSGLKAHSQPPTHTHTLLCAPLTDGVAEAGQAAAGARVSVVVVEATLAVGAVRVVGAVPAVPAVTGGPVQLGIEVTLGTLPVTLAG